MSDLELDAEGRPFVGYSVQKDSAGLPPGQGGTDHRYRLARWTERPGQDGELAFAGTRLYAGEDDYTGGVALVPGDPTARLPLDERRPRERGAARERRGRQAALGGLARRDEGREAAAGASGR